MSDVVIRRAEPGDAPVLAALRRRFKVEEDGDGAPPDGDVPQGGDVPWGGDVPPDGDVPQGEERFLAECGEWLRTRLAGPWRAWLAVT
ncbi:hypothetical protein [Streptomyces catenulae]|uniref:hypothetical protein n=1 Tax=Streptomyces catenulae TaxID=66875 RepID=UPI001FDF051B|nr:hypothetical protein [Streptomyces catenulae]